MSASRRSTDARSSSKTSTPGYLRWSSLVLKEVRIDESRPGDDLYIGFVKLAKDSRKGSYSVQCLMLAHSRHSINRLAVRPHVRVITAASDSADTRVTSLNLDNTVEIIVADYSTGLCIQNQSTRSRRIERLSTNKLPEHQAADNLNGKASSLPDRPCMHATTHDTLHRWH